MSISTLCESRHPAYDLAMIGSPLQSPHRRLSGGRREPVRFIEPCRPYFVHDNGLSKLQLIRKIQTASGHPDGFAAG
jgi:hypothetical protein